MEEEMKNAKTDQEKKDAGNQSERHELRPLRGGHDQGHGESAGGEPGAGGPGQRPSDLRVRRPYPPGGPGPGGQGGGL